MGTIFIYFIPNKFPYKQPVAHCFIVASFLSKRSSTSLIFHLPKNSPETNPTNYTKLRGYRENGRDSFFEVRL